MAAARAQEELERKKAAKAADDAKAKAEAKEAAERKAAKEAQKAAKQAARFGDKKPKRGRGQQPRAAQALGCCRNRKAAI